MESDEDDNYIEYQLSSSYSQCSDEFHCDEVWNEDYLDQEEELRGFNHQIDFTLHTILEESGEDSEHESRFVKK